MDEDRKKALDDAYRVEGWGKITDAALEIRPSDVENQARDVARWAHGEIKRLRAVLEPFARIAPHVENTDLRDGNVVHRQRVLENGAHAGWMELTKGHFRAARDAHGGNRG